MNKILRVCIALISLFYLSGIDAHAADFIEFDADGEYRIVSDCEADKDNGKFDFYTANIRNGFLFEDKLFFFDGYLLKELTLNSGKVRVLKNLEEILPNVLPWYIGSVTKTKLYFSCYGSSSGFIGGTKTSNISLFEFSFDKFSIEKVKVDTILDDLYFSVKGSEIYFKNIDGNISSLSNGKIKIYRIDGTSPSISADGKKIAYIKSGVIFNSIRVYNIFDETDLKIISVPLFMKAQPNIRWTNDSHNILIGATSDIRKPFIASVDMEGNQTCRKETSAVNWFYYEK